MESPEDLGTRRSANTALIVLALAGAVTPIAIAVFDRNRLWHEGVDGFLVAVVCSVLVVRSEPGTWQHGLAKALLVLAAVVLAIVIALGVLLVVAIGKHGFSGM